MAEWTNVKQALPKSYGQVLVFTVYGDVATCYYFTTRQRKFDFPDDVTHWMEIPSGPNECKNCKSTNNNHSKECIAANKRSYEGKSNENSNELQNTKDLRSVQ